MGPTGRGWALDGEPDCYDFIDGWYDDYETTRWNAHGDEADLHMVLVAPVNSYTGPLSLKAAHGSIGSLTVCKETLGELLPSDYDTAFTFELTLDDDTITTIDDKWCGVPFKNGKASFTLKSGESITLSNLPAGIGYTITEIYTHISNQLIEQAANASPLSEVKRRRTEKELLMEEVEKQNQAQENGTKDQSPS